MKPNLRNWNMDCGVGAHLDCQIWEKSVVCNWTWSCSFMRCRWPWWQVGWRLLDSFNIKATYCVIWHYKHMKQKIFSHEYYSHFIYLRSTCSSHIVFAVQLTLDFNGKGTLNRKFEFVGQSRQFKFGGGIENGFFFFLWGWRLGGRGSVIYPFVYFQAI